MNAHPDPAQHKLWRDHSGFLAVPTLLLAVGVWAGALSTWSAVAAGLLPMWLGSILMVVVVYASFTPMHEAAHGNISGSRRLWWIDEAVGWATSLLFLAPYPAFKVVHLRHHGVVNQQGRDPDLWVAGTGPAMVLLRCLSILPHYYAVFLGPLAAESPVNRRARRFAVGGFVVLALGFAGVIAAGLGLELLMLWILPAWVASGLLALAFDWIPHQPHGDPGRWTNARVILAPGLTFVMLWQNYHLIHHLWPKVPFYRYATVFRLTRATLEFEGSPIEEPLAR